MFGSSRLQLCGCLSSVPIRDRLVHDRKPPTGASKPGVHDVVEDRPEAVAETQLDEVTVGRLKLTSAEQSLLITQITARQIELVAEKGELPERKEGESLEQPKIEGVEEN